MTKDAEEHGGCTEASTASIFKAEGMSAALWTRLQCTGDSRNYDVAALTAVRFFGIAGIPNGNNTVKKDAGWYCSGG